QLGDPESSRKEGLKQGPVTFSLESAGVGCGQELGDGLGVKERHLGFVGARQVNLVSGQGNDVFLGQESEECPQGNEVVVLRCFAEFTTVEVEAVGPNELIGNCAHRYLAGKVGESAQVVLVILNRAAGQALGQLAVF